MPKGINIGFGRRKSAGNVLESPDAPSSSFRVIERPEKKSSRDGAEQPEVKRSFASPLQALRGKSVDNLTSLQNRSVESPSQSQSRPRLKIGRGSAGTTNSGSSGYDVSSATSGRHSSSSTLPSSLEQERESEDNLFAVRSKPQAPMRQTQAPAPIRESVDLPPPPSFSSRAARAFSFGNKNKSSKDLSLPPVPPPHVEPLPKSPPQMHSPQRERAMTTSSYASTAVPMDHQQPQSALTLDASDFGADDFGSMFDNMKRQSRLPNLDTKAGPGNFHRTVSVSGPSEISRANIWQDSEPLYPPKTLSRRSFTPSPNRLANEASDTPYGWDQDARNGSKQSDSTVSSPDLDETRQAASLAQSFLQKSKVGYSRVPEAQASPDPEESLFAHRRPQNARKDEPAFPNRQAQLDDGDRWVKRVELSDPQEPKFSSPMTTRSPVNVRTGTPKGNITSPASGRIDEDALNATPRAKLGNNDLADEPLFDSSPVGPPSRAVRQAAQPRSETTQNRRMTKEQFKMLQRRGEPSGSSADQSEDEAQSGNEDVEDEDDIDRARRMANQRRKQEANMSVYRQQMKRVTGGGPTDLPFAAPSRPDVSRGSSAPSLSGLHLGGIGGVPPSAAPRARPADSDEDDDVPLGILQAHGFPSSARPPTRLEGEGDHQRRASTAGSVVNGGGGGGGLPVFARKLPHDPYYGAGLVNPSNRESLAFGSSASVYGGMGTSSTPPPMQAAAGHPGGLVGVIAGEERARAARRASPNPTAGFGSTSFPLPSNMQQPMPRTMSMGNMAGPQMFPGGMPMMPGMQPNMMMPMGMDPNSVQMQQQFVQMQMQMQMMQNMLQLQQAQLTGAAPPAPVNDFLSPNTARSIRPASILSNSGYGNGGRSMTMTALPNGWNGAPNSRPTSSVFGANGPGPGYTPSIAPSERSNVGMPGRYRAVSYMNGLNGSSVDLSNGGRPISTVGGPTNGAGRSQSLTSSMTLNAFTNQQAAPAAGTPFNASAAASSPAKSTIRVVEKPKGSAPMRPSSRANQLQVDEEEDDDGWAEMRQKREAKKKGRWGGLGGGGDKEKSGEKEAKETKSKGRHSRNASAVLAMEEEKRALAELYPVGALE